MKKLILLTALCTITIVHGTPVYEHISAHLLKNFPLTKATTEVSKDAKGNMTFHLPRISDLEEHSALLKLLADYEVEHQPLAHHSRLSMSSAQDLNLYFYDKSRPDYTLLGTLYRGTTNALGKVALAHQLATPTDDRATLENRQALLAWFTSHPEQTAEIKALLSEFVTHEKMLLSLWNENDLLYTNTVRDQFYGGSFKKWCADRGATKLELKRRLSDAQMILFPAAITLYDWAVSRLTHYLDKQDYVARKAAQMKRKGELTNGNALSTPQQEALEKEFDNEKALMTFIKKHPIIFACMAAFSGYAVYTTIKQVLLQVNNRIALVRHLQQRLASLVAFDELITKMDALMSQYPDLCTLLPAARVISAYTNGSGQEHQEFLENIHSPAFKQTSYFFANIGSILHTLPQFIEIRNRFAPLLSAVGTIDAAIGLSEVYTQSQHQPVSYCLAEYATSETPALDIQDFWHPLLDPQVVVTNSLKMGAPEAKDIVLTGPNASGKSMTLKALSLCVLLSQTVGFAPARCCQLTPFTQITTHLNIADSLGENQSLFKAEVIRAQDLVESAKRLPSDQFVFNVMDEIFSSTAPAEGEAAAYGVAYAMAQQPNALTVLATHFSKLTTLPRITDNIFKNYKVYVIRREDGSYEHPFTLEPGRSHQVIALDLMRQEGFDSQILDFAQSFLARQNIDDMNDVRTRHLE